MSRYRAYGALVVATACWGVATAVAKFAVGGLGAFTTLVVESGVAAAVLVGFAWQRNVRPSVPLWEYALLGLVEPALAYGALDLGLRFTTAATAALLDGLQSCFVLIMGAVILGERIRLRSGVGVALAAAGVVVLTAWRTTLTVGLGDGLVLVGSLAASLSVVIVNRIAQNADTLELTTYQFGFGFLWSLPVVGVVWATKTEPVPGWHDLRYLAGAAGIGLGAFLVGYLLYNFAVARVPVGVAGMALNLIPIFGLAAAAILLAERVRTAQIVGGLLILTGLALFPYTSESGDVHRDLALTTET